MFSMEAVSFEQGMIQIVQQAIIRRSKTVLLIHLHSYPNLTQNPNTRNTSEEVWEVSKAQRQSLTWLLEDYQQRFQSRNEAMAQAYRSEAYTMAEIGGHFEVHYMTGSQAVQQFEGTSPRMSECENGPRTKVKEISPGKTGFAQLGFAN